MQYSESTVNNSMTQPTFSYFHDDIWFYCFENVAGMVNRKTGEILDKTEARYACKKLRG